ncbi:MAG: Uma2 family endonuclease [Saprospiraceae bacterium]
MVEAPEYISNVRFNFRNGPIRLYEHGMTDEDFYNFCFKNPELRIERSPNGQIIIMPPTTSETGRRNFEIALEIGLWNRQFKLGHVFDSSTGFKLPNGAERSPDTSWILKERWDALLSEDKQKFAPIVPDFVLELRSQDQGLNELREKMAEYMDCGCRLGWLIDPQNRRTYVYSANGDIQTIKFEDILSGYDLMPGLNVRLADILD